MQMYFAPFYRLHGIRRVDHFITPRLLTIAELPRDSVVHYQGNDPQHPDIDPSLPFFGPATKKIAVDYVQDYPIFAAESNPRKLNKPFRALIRDFHRTNKKFRFVPDALSKINDQTTLLVINYGYLQPLHAYAKYPLEAWYRFQNDYTTLFANISEISKTTTKNHFVMVDLPETLPSLMLLNTYSKRMSPTALRIFDTPSELFLLDFWQWLSDVNRGNTIFKNLKEEDYSKTNLVFRAKDGRSVVLNLGYVNSWIKGHEVQAETKNVQQYRPDQIQRVFLKFAITLTSALPDQEIVDDVAENNIVTDPADVEEAEALLAEQKEYLREHEDDADSVPEGEFDSASGDPADLYAGFKSTKNTRRSVPNEDIRERMSSLDADIDKSMTMSADIADRLKAIDSDLSALDTLTNRRLRDRGIHLDKHGEMIELEDPIEDIPVEVLRNRVLQPETYEDSLKRQIGEFADYGLLSASDYKKALQDINKYKESKDPYGSGKLTTDAMVVTPESILLDPNKTQMVVSSKVADATMAQSTLMAFDHDYVKNVIKKDMLGMINTLQKSGVVIRRHEVEIDNSALGTYENHTLELKPIDGQASTLRFRLPQVQTDGTFTANGNKYVMRKQRVDVPIRKTNPFTVALTSYYGKTFVTVNQKKANNSLAYLVKELNKASMDDSHPYIKRVAPANVFDNKFKAPFIYNGLASSFKSVTTSKYYLTFDHVERETLFDESVIQQLERNGSRVVGRMGAKPVVVDKNDMFHVQQEGTLVPIGDIYTVLELDAQKAPVDYSEIRIFSKTVPVGVVLGYSIGFKNLLKLLEAKYEIVEGRRVGELEAHQYVISFRDQKYILDRRQRTATLILAGFLEYEKQLRMYEAKEFDKKDVYLNLLETKGLGSLYIRELELTNQLFIDPITKSILEQMNEPVTFNGLLLRATELLETYHHPDAQDMRFMRIRGYERFPGAVYKELVSQIRSYRNRNLSGKSRVEMSPYQVWQSVMKDPAIKLVEDINPIQNLKESEIITYVGTGGRSKDSMSKDTRSFHEQDMGVVSEATVDSSDVGINAYLSANPNFADLRGTVASEKNFNPANLVSTSALLAPGSNHDDPKRTNFISIQQSHTIAADGYHQPYVRTGYEYAIGNRTSDLFCYTAKDDGKVVGLNETGIIVEYQDGTRKGVTLGRSYGKAEGSVYPHDVTSPMKLGQKFKKGDVVAYNTGFFEIDYLDKTKVVMKNSMNVTVALLESNQTHEDSSSISKELGVRMRSKTTKIRSFTVNFDQNLVDVVKPGQRVSPKDFLMIIEDEITSSSNIFDAKSLEILKKLSNQAPQAQHLGVIDRIEVFYHGAKGDMSASLKSLADRSDRLMSEICRSSDKPVITGQVNDDYRVSGVPLGLDKAEVKIYITIETDAGVGDKGVFANQMKSVIGEVMDYSIHAEDGTKIDATFGFRSIAARIVESPLIIGTTTTLLKKIGQRAVSIYRNQS